MGRLFQLFNMVDLREQAPEVAKLKPQERQAEIERIHNSTNLVGIWSPETFTVSFRGEVVTIKQGWNEYAPSFGVWALQKYGKGSLYGKTFHTGDDGKIIDNPEILDEPPSGEQPAVRKVRAKAEAE